MGACVGQKNIHNIFLCRHDTLHKFLNNEPILKPFLGFETLLSKSIICDPADKNRAKAQNFYLKILMSSKELGPGHSCMSPDWLCEVAIGPTSTGLVLSHRRCLYQTWALFRFWRKKRVPRSGFTMTISSIHQRRFVSSWREWGGGIALGSVFEVRIWLPMWRRKQSYTQNIMSCGASSGV